MKFQNTLTFSSTNIFKSFFTCVFTTNPDHSRHHYSHPFGMSTFTVLLSMWPFVLDAFTCTK